MMMITTVAAISVARKRGMRFLGAGASAVS